MTGNPRRGKFPPKPLWSGTLAPEVRSQNTKDEIKRSCGLIRLPRQTSGQTSNQPHFPARNKFRI